MSVYRLIATMSLSVLVTACAGTLNDKYPQTSDDGLERIASKTMDAVYWHKDATLAQYTKVSIDKVDVEFRKNWLRDQNTTRVSINNRVTAADMDKIRASMADIFRDEFTKALTKAGYEVVDEAGDNVLLLKPEIVDLNVNAPDISLHQTGSSSSYTTSTGEMTLNMELYDSATHALIGRAIDHRRDLDDSFLTYTTSVSNRAEAARVMRQWARTLVKALDEAKK